ncbi:MAG: DUF4864 domain-containing protein [Leucothrix sp.]
MIKLISYFLLAGFLAASPMTLADEKTRDAAITAVVTDQIDAFSKDDSKRAFSHASPMIKAGIRSHERFLMMVKRSYGMIYRPSSHEMQEVKSIEGKLYQVVLFVDQDRNRFKIFYEMQKQDDGSWKINGVTPFVATDDVFA